MKNTKRIISARDFGKMQRDTEMFNKALSKASGMICNSEYTKDYYLSKYPEHKDKVFTVYNVIDGKEIAHQSTEKTEKEFLDFVERHNKVISVVGGFVRKKALNLCLNLLLKLRKLHI